MHVIIKSAMMEAIVDSMDKEEKDKIMKAKAEIEKIVFKEDGTVIGPSAIALLMVENELEIKAKEQLKAMEEEPEKKDADG